MIGADIAAAVRALPAQHRVIVYLAGVEGLSYREISQATGIPAGSVKSALHRSRAGSAVSSPPAPPAPALAPPAGRGHRRNGHLMTAASNPRGHRARCGPHLARLAALARGPTGVTLQRLPRRPGRGTAVTSRSRLSIAPGQGHTARQPRTSAGCGTAVPSRS